MKKNLIIFMPSIEKGGVEKNLFIVSNYLAKKHDYVSLITISKKFKSKFDKSINFITLSSKYWDNCGRRFKFLLSFFLLIIEILKNKNTVVFSFQANIYTIFICKIFSIKNIVRCNSSPTGWSKNFIKIILYKYFLNKADKVMVNSLEFKNELKKRFKVNSTCIYNPLNIKEIIKKSKFKSKKLFNSKKKFKILNIGRCTEQKDQITFLKAIKIIEKLIPLEAVIIGEGPLKKKLEYYLKLNNLNTKVSFKNFTENPYPYLKQSDLFVLSSRYEGLPNVLLESIALQKISISSSCPTGPKEILLNGKGGFLFKVGNYEELSKKILFCYKNKSKCNKIIKKSYLNLKRFDYEKNLNKYFKLVSNFL